jgi:hypothetical protein
MSEKRNYCFEKVNLNFLPSLQRNKLLIEIKKENSEKMPDNAKRRKTKEKEGRQTGKRRERLKL